MNIEEQLEVLTKLKCEHINIGINPNYCYDGKPTMYIVSCQYRTGYMNIYFNVDSKTIQESIDHIKSRIEILKNL